MSGCVCRPDVRKKAKEIPKGTAAVGVGLSPTEPTAFDRARSVYSSIRRSSHSGQSSVTAFLFRENKEEKKKERKSRSDFPGWSWRLFVTSMRWRSAGIGRNIPLGKIGRGGSAKLTVLGRRWEAIGGVSRARIRGSNLSGKFGKDLLFSEGVAICQYPHCGK